MRHQQQQQTGGAGKEDPKDSVSHEKETNLCYLHSFWGHSYWPRVFCFLEQSNQLLGISCPSYRATVDHVKRAIARRRFRCRFQQPNTTVLCVRERERKRASCPPPSRLLSLFPVPFLGLPSFLLHSLSISFFSLLLLFPRPKVATGSCLSFLLPLLLSRASAITFRLLPRILCFRIELIPATVGFSSNQPLPSHFPSCPFLYARIQI